MLKNYKITSLITMAAISLSSNVASAQHIDHDIKNNFFYSKAKVINIEPIIRNVQVTTPKKECWQEEITRPVYTQHNSGHGKTLVGGIIGGIVGNQFGRGDGKRAATVVGSIIGAAVGNDIAKKSRYTTRSERVDVEHHCRVTQITHSEQRTEGYWVTYRFKGEMFTTRMDQQPGKKLKVRVQVTPILD